MSKPGGTIPKASAKLLASKVKVYRPHMSTRLGRASHYGSRLTFVYYSPSLIAQEVPMDVRAHTTPDDRQALRSYLRNRRLTTSVHQTITAQTLNDLEEALRLLEG